MPPAGASWVDDASYFAHTTTGPPEQVVVVVRVARSDISFLIARAREIGKGEPKAARRLARKG